MQDYEVKVKDKVLGSVAVGDIVLFYMDADERSTPFPAIVTGIGLECLCVHYFSRESKSLMIKDGVRHVSDSRARLAEMRDCGSWDWSERDRRLVRLEAEVARLVAAIAKK